MERRRRKDINVQFILFVFVFHPFFPSFTYFITVFISSHLFDVIIENLNFLLKKFSSLNDGEKNKTGWSNEKNYGKLRR